MGEQLRLRRQQANSRTELPLPLSDNQEAGQNVRESASPLATPLSLQNPASGYDFGQIPIVRPQTKLAISQPGDPAEQEADRVAEEMMHEEAAALALNPANSSAARQLSLARQAATQMPVDADPLPLVREGTRTGGDPLAPEARAAMEPRFGHDFGQVRVHTDARAAESAQGMRARAYTVGPDIIFGTGQYAPTTNEGQRLLAHELTHVVQQTGGAPYVPVEQHESQPSGESVARSINTSRQAAAVQRQAYLQPLPEWGDGGDSKITFNAHADLIVDGGPAIGAWFNGVTTDQFTNIPRNCTGSVRIVNDVFWYYHETHILGDDRRSGMQRTSTTDVRFKVEKGKLSFLTPAEPSGGGGVPGLFTLDVATSPAVAQPDGSSGSVGLKTHFKADATQPGKQTTVSTGVGTEGGGEVDIKVAKVGGKVTRTAGIQVQSSGLTTTGAGQRDGSFLINLLVKPATPHDETVPIYFDTGKATMKFNQQQDLIRWWSKIPEDIQKDIRSGATQIRLMGYASTLGDEPANPTDPNAKPRVDNFKLSEDRNTTVKTLLMRIIGGLQEKSVFPDPKGSALSKTYGDPAEYAQDQRVDVRVHWEVD